ncbi:50S ribosome-binding GTPase [Caballeronia sp. LZ033]|uniref:YcjF family protein n=1 Tax=Caballeronia sp. LZ033 TaxID=3038566 RepID=UPI00285A66CB|nr:GTPase [Caballeronia sp. LZ033]MDR5812064.1 50S ribosome-binding GTPase [Caballeronia sp. LZ033]
MTQDFQKIIEDALRTAKAKVGHANVLIAGKTGVGKSTLVNAVFQGDLAKTGIGRPVTQNTREYTKAGIPLTIIDTKGIEVADYENTKKQLEDAIRDRNGSDDAKQHVHVAWICIAEDSRRVEQAEADLLELLARYRIPTVAVITKARSNNGFDKEVERLLPASKQVVRVRAIRETLDEGHELLPVGLKELVEVTSQLFPEGQANAFVAAQKVDLSKKTERSHLAVGAAAVSAAGIGAIPIPFSDAIGIVPVQVTMIATISAIFGLNLSEGFIGTLVGSSMSAIGGTLAGRAAVGALLKLIPGVGSVVGGAISGTTAAALTTAFGEAYIYALCTLLEKRSIEDLTAKEVADAFVNRLKRSH